MNFIEQGGLMMGPLLAISILACVIIVERFLFFSSLNSTSLIIPKNMDEQEDVLRLEFQTYIKNSQFLSYLRMKTYQEILLSSESAALKEAHLYNEGQALLSKCSYGLNMLNTIVRSAPLMGLLGTVIGMIDTFSRLANQQSGVDIGLLAGGIWQALITTATGLVIAIFALLAHQYFISKKNIISDNLEALARISLAYTK